ncbi:MAG: hypothetical protein OEX21_10480 [Betaproteobacteria bacterium]|nr:hypothetical protein [Betaproteobacteria bacterium]
MRPLALFLAAAATTWAAAAAAQDRDSYDFREGYRRGYDDGFASGYRKGLAEGARAAPAAPAAPPPPPVPTGPITVSTAYYGTSSKSCDATRWVARKVNGRRTASFEVTNDMCGDPAKGDRKQLEITYVCGSIAKTASAYEHRTVYLDCTN